MCDTAVMARYIRLDMLSTGCIEKVPRVLNDIRPNCDRIFINIKGRVYTSCLKSCLIRGSETQPMKKEQDVKLDRTEPNMLRWMCGFQLQTSQNVGTGASQSGYRERQIKTDWIGHVERKDDALRRLTEQDRHLVRLIQEDMKSLELLQEE